jgi:hypothetical protein
MDQEIAQKLRSKLALSEMNTIKGAKIELVDEPMKK